MPGLASRNPAGLPDRAQTHMHSYLPAGWESVVFYAIMDLGRDAAHETGEP